MNFKKEKNENREEFIWRLCSDKADGLIDMSWKELAAFLNGELYDNEEDYVDESALRKQFQAAKKFKENVFDKVQEIDDDPQMEKMRILTKRLQEERVKLSTEKLEYNRRVRQESRFDLLFENIAKLIPILEVPEVVYTPNSEGDRIHVLGIGDIHYGANFISENNIYSREECVNRFNNLLGNMVDYIQDNDVYQLKIVNVADTIQGMLRVSDIKLNETDVVMSVVEISKIISDFLNKLSAYVNIEYYHVTHSNHSQTRPLGTQAGALAKEDLEKIIANYIKDTLTHNDRVEVLFDVDKEYIDFDIFDFACTAEHGHRIKNIKKFLQDKGNVRRKIYSYGFVGHTHSAIDIIVGEEENSNVEVFVIPSFIGSDPYADTLNLGSKAMARMYVFDEKYGHIESKNIILN